MYGDEFNSFMYCVYVLYNTDIELNYIIMFSLSLLADNILCLPLKDFQ